MHISCLVSEFFAILDNLPFSVRFALSSQYLPSQGKRDSLLCPLSNAFCDLSYALCALPYAPCSLLYALCAMPYAPCSLPYAMPYALCPMPHAPYPMRHALCSMRYALCTEVGKFFNFTRHEIDIFSYSPFSFKCILLN